MSDIEQKALALLNTVRSRGEGPIQPTHNEYRDALCRAIEQHEAFRQEVSDVASVCAQHFCKNSWTIGDRQNHVDMLSRLIVPAPKPDPLVEALDSLGLRKADEWAGDIRKALAARGLDIREKAQ